MHIPQFKRKFVISNNPIDHPLLTGWQNGTIGGRHAYWDDSLPVVIRGNERIEIGLFGYMLDPERTADSDEQIVDGIVNTAESLEDVIRVTNRMCGRWALFVAIGSRQYIINDAAGQRQAFYHLAEGVEIIASSEHLLASLFGLQRSERTVNEFFAGHTPEFLTGCWFVGDSTIYDGVFCLVPSHALDIAARKQVRFWPLSRRRVHRQDREANFEIIHNLIDKHFEALFHRFGEAALALTGGLDSRSSLAHCKPFKDKILCYTVNTGQGTGVVAEADRSDRGLDYKVPGEITTAYGIKYALYDRIGKLPEWYVTEYNLNASLNRPVFQHMAYQMFNEGYPQHKVSIQSCINELSRSQYVHRPYRVKLKELANFTSMGHLPFVMKNLQSWYEGAVDLNNEYGTRIEDLFFLEQLMGRWSAMNRNEWDFVQEAFEPFNSRDLIFRIFCIDQPDRLRWPNKFYLYRFKRAWPELLDFQTTVQEKYFGKPQIGLHIRQGLKRIYYALGG